MGGLVVQGAALGAAFELLFVSAIDATQKIARFDSDLNRLISTLCFIKPVIDDIDSFNRILDRPRHETEAFTARLIEAQKLVGNCLKVKNWNLVMRLYYSIKLSKLEASLVKFFQINVAVLHFRESKRISVVVSNLEEKINELITIMKRCDIDGSEREDLPEILVGVENESMHKDDGNTSTAPDYGREIIEISPN